VSERLGHASIKLTLNTNSHCLPTLQKNATQRLDGMFGLIGRPMAVRRPTDPRHD
jgi:hypothetical protein